MSSTDSSVHGYVNAAGTSKSRTLTRALYGNMC
jgi:hypothetical protein